MSRVLVTGGSGYLGSHTVVSALRAGHEVRTTVRESSRSRGVRQMLEDVGLGDASVEVVVADLVDDTGWIDAVSGCDGVLHVASPIPLAPPEDPDDLVVPARDGSVRVVRAAERAGVRRLVLTSSFAAIGYGRSVSRPWTGEDWTDPAADLPAYPLSKVVAERAAWEASGEGGDMEMVTLNPTGIFGPLLTSAVSSSASLVQGLLSGRMTPAPRQSFGVADVRDVADAHVRALEVPEAAGRRFLLVSPPATSWLGLAETLREVLGERAAQTPTSEAPGEPVAVNEFDVSPARDLLAWPLRSPQQTIADMVESMDRWGLLPS